MSHNHEPAEAPPARQPPPPAGRWSRIRRHPLFYTLLVSTCFSAYEVVKEFLRPTWTKWQSHELSIVAVTLVTGVAIFRVTAVMRRQIELLGRQNAELAAAQKKATDAARLAGMAEVATGVLHNVGNVLNGANVSVTIVANKVRQPRLPNLLRATALLGQHKDDLAGFPATDQGRQLAPYLELASGQLAQDHEDVLRELASLTQNIGHIKEIVAMQQSYGKVSGVIELIPATDLVEDALRLNAAALERHHVDVVREFQPMPPLQVNKHKVLQILVNLISNAKYAMDEADPKGRRLTIRVRAAEQPGRMQVQVIDTGKGIAAENLTRIFSHGFTMRRGGHGFGLHSSALAASEMGGSLVAASEGLGRGATFTFELPLGPPKAQTPGRNAGSDADRNSAPVDYVSPGATRTQ